jgi:hypothetical protein
LVYGTAKELFGLSSQVTISILWTFHNFFLEVYIL